MNARGWFGGAVSSFTSTVSAIYTAVKDTVVGVYNAPSISGYLGQFAVQFWEGFTRVFDPGNVTKIVSAPRTRRTLTESSKANIVYYLGVALLLEATKEAILIRVLSGDDTWMDTTISLTMNAFVMVSLSGVAAHRYYDNTLLTMTAAKQVSEEVPLEGHYQGCECDSGALIKAGLMSPMNLSSKIVSIWAGSYLPVIRYVTPFAYTYAYGESLAEYPHAASGTCTDHRAQKLAKENGYAFGLGASLYFVGESIAYLLSRYTGASGIFVSNAIYAAIYPYFVTAVLLRDRPLPTKHNGVDFYYYHRHLTDHMITTVGGQILPMLQNSDKTVEWKVMFQAVVNTPPARVARLWMSYDLYGDWRSPHTFVLSPPNKLFMDEYYAMIIKEIDKIIDLREKPLHQRRLKELPMAMLAPVVPKLPSRLTRFIMSDAYKKLVKIIFADWVEDPLKATRRFFEEIKRIQSSARITIIADNDPVWQQLEQREAQQSFKVEVLDDPVAQVDVPKPNQVGLFAQSNEGLVQRRLPQDQSHIRKKDFLIELKNKANEVTWNNKGTTLFGVCTPDKIEKLREILGSVHSHSSLSILNEAIVKIELVFKDYRPLESRDKTVERFYREIIHNLTILREGEGQTLVALHGSQGEKLVDKAKY